MASESVAEVDALTKLSADKDDEDGAVAMESEMNAEWSGLQNRATLDVVVKSLSFRPSGSLIRENSARGSSVYDSALYAPLLPRGQPWTAHSP